MANYTMELRTLINDYGNPFDHIEYEHYNNSYKKKFEEKFIKHFYFREIGVETIERFIHNLECKLNEIYPYYKHLYSTTTYDYDPILNYNVEEEIKRNLDEIVNGVSSGKSSNVSQGTNTSIQYDTPITPIANTRKTPSFIEEGRGDNENTSSSSNEVNNATNTNEVHRRTTKGNIGVMTTQDLIMKERQIIINIDKLIFEECEDLFMQVF